jgi:hypothetical protein
MRNKLLLGTVALLAGMTLASAQQMPGGGGAPGAPSGAGQERQTPPTQRGQEGQPQRGKDQQGQQGQQGQPQRGKDQTTGQRGEQAPGQMQREQGKDQQGQPPRGKDQQGQQGQPQRGKDDKGTTGQREPGQGQTQQRPADTPKQSQPQREQREQGQQGAQQQGGGAALNAEQRTKIRQQVLVSGAPRVTNVDFSVSVGTVVPQHVRVVAVPDVIVEIHPQWRGYLYFVVEDRIIIVDRNHRIVAILVV